LSKFCKNIRFVSLTRLLLGTTITNEVKQRKSMNRSSKAGSINMNESGIFNGVGELNSPTPLPFMGASSPTLRSSKLARQKTYAIEG
jgi:hypothetical protein